MIGSKFLFREQGYDYIFFGAGCASLSLLMRMIRSGRFAEKKILLIDKEAKNKNDRTWCFWETQPGFFEDIVYRRWDTISFLSDDFSATTNIGPYQYKMIRGIDFYKFCFDEIGKHGNVEVVYGEVGGWKYEKDAIILNIDNRDIKLFDQGTQIFNSVYKPGEPDKRTIRLLQHFTGWTIQTDKPIFKSSEATMMDFRVHQLHGTSFAYVLPFNATTALVEYTLFTKELLLKEQYDAELRNYINQFLAISDYRVIEEEFGVIPMTNERFRFASNCWQIGTAGGQTKASTGYTFQFIQKQSQQITDCLILGKNLNYLSGTPKRFRFYDNTFLHILYHDKLPGKKVFTQLFKKNKPQQVLKFLDNESSFAEELKIITTLPAIPFLKAAVRQF